MLKYLYVYIYSPSLFVNKMKETNALLNTFLYGQGIKDISEGPFRRRDVSATDNSAISLLQYLCAKLFTVLKSKRQNIILFDFCFISNIN